MKSFRVSLKDFVKGLRKFQTGPLNKDTLIECFNVAPTDEGLEIHETITSLNASGETWGGEGVFGEDVLTEDKITTDKVSF